MTIISRLLFLFLIWRMVVVDVTLSLPARDEYPHIIAHRGASGYVPGHSLQAYQLAIDLLADYIEPDLCLTKDGIFVVMGDIVLDETTNVASLPQFVDRKTTKMVEGTKRKGYFVSDFTLSELKQLRLKQRYNEVKSRTTLFDGLFEIPTFEEVMSLAHSEYRKSSRMIGIYPELKKPIFHKKALGFNMVDLFLNAVQAGGYAVKGKQVPRNLKQVVPVLIQCLDTDTLLELKQKSDLPLMQGIQKTSHSDWTEDKIAKIASYASAVGPEKSYFESSSYQLVRNTIRFLHSYNVTIHPWTFRADSGIGRKFQGEFRKEQIYFYCCLGVDAVFSDFPDRTREIVDVIKEYQKIYPGKCPINCETP
jgi:glycerophosphoryl diester phosphodiesterase